ncbi:putative D-/L-hydantoinase subunit A [Lachnellula hyalina]|uniref:Putative D-/L-hydantoinase subunit A n=1 Tax=Lachnellula hyalina TaxID=1316788 RepID=A0A8H8RAY1_9HELO|nr:putative D-/L-hydantoinase subunit A [Lachnellula hyalina]TVY30036.1 putative D-/L-hydantoinase subunit A [Lachnellula hyalina]
MSSPTTQTSSDRSAMPSKLSSCVIGIDVGGTNTDSVILQGDNVLAWHKTPTTSDIQDGVEKAIEEVVKKAGISPHHVGSVKIGTTQFVNAVMEQDSSKLDKVAVIRLCGPYSRGSPPFVDFPSKLRTLMQGHVGYVDGGYQVDGAVVAELSADQLKEQATIIKSKSISSIVVVGIYSPSNPTQEEEARRILSSELGPGYDISCSHAIGRLGFLERENAGILNASLRRFARHVIAGFSYAVQRLGKCKLYITLNDGTLSKAITAAQYPVRCFSSGPTNSARGAALLAKSQQLGDSASDEREVLVVDVGGTTTDICALLKTGYPRQSGAFVKIAGVRTNFTIPDVHSIALGGGSLIRIKDTRTSVGPDSVGSRLEQESIAFGGETLTANDLVFSSEETDLVPSKLKALGLKEIARKLESAIDLVKTKQGDAKVILVGGGSIIIADKIAGVGEIIRPKYLEVANAVGAAISKIAGSVDTTFVPGAKTIDQAIEAAKALATERCVAAGGNKNSIKVMEVDVVPISYVTNGATKLLVRVVGDLLEGYEENFHLPESLLDGEIFRKEDLEIIPNGLSKDANYISKTSSYDVVEQLDIESYRPRIDGDLWYLSELDLQFFLDGTGVLGVGSCGEPYPTYIACLETLRAGGEITIRRQDTFPDDGVVLMSGFMGGPSVYLERIPGLTEISDAIEAVMKAAGLETFDAVVPNEIGGMNAFEAFLAAHRFKKSVLDTDLVARAYPFIWQTIRCLNDLPVVPAAIANGAGKTEVFKTAKDNLEAEDLMRGACVNLGSLTGMCTCPVYGAEAKTLPKNSFSHAWQIGRAIALSRSLKQDPLTSLLASEDGILLFSGKIISVTRSVSEGFTRGSVLLEPFSESLSSPTTNSSSSTLFIEFENENLSAILRNEGEEDKVLAVCPDLITLLDKSNGAPLGISDYKYGLRVSVVALRSPPVWTTDKGLEMGGPKAFGLDITYKSVGTGEYTPPKSVWEMFGETAS